MPYHISGGAERFNLRRISLLVFETWYKMVKKGERNYANKPDTMMFIQKFPTSPGRSVSTPVYPEICTNNGIA